jgi:hypothetical protein
MQSGLGHCTPYPTVFHCQIINRLLKDLQVTLRSNRDRIA